MRLLVTVLTALVSAAALAHADQLALKDTVPHITTTGTAATEVVPDLADVRIGVRNERLNADDAAAATAKAAADVLADIKKQGIDSRDIKSNFELSAVYDSSPGVQGGAMGRKLRGYDATARIQVHLHDVTRAGSLARELIAKGANEFEGISFSYSKQKQTLRDLNGAALRDAMAEARSFTDAAGLKLGRVLQIGEDPQTESDGVADMPSRRPLLDSSVAVPIEPGSQTLTQSVTVIWEIIGKAN